MGNDKLDQLIDRESLMEYLEETIGSSDTFEAKRHSEGYSNETLFISWGDNEYVLRRPPIGETADTAHDVLREYRAMDALQGTDVPVPRTVAACEDHGVIGCDFYLMEKLIGDVIRMNEPERFRSKEDRERIGYELVDVLTEIHNVDLDGVGLGEFGKPMGYTERQVDRWHKQIDWAFETTLEERDVPVLREVGEWLDDNKPGDHPHTLVHGDYKLDNVMFAASSDTPMINGVLDWEMSTLGDPLCDLGWMLYFWPEETDTDYDILAAFHPNFLQSDDYPSRAELVERYEDRTGFGFENHRFYRALAGYKMAALGEMFYARFLMGNSDNVFYEMMEDGVPMIAGSAMDIIEGEAPL